MQWQLNGVKYLLNPEQERLLKELTDSCHEAGINYDLTFIMVDEHKHREYNSTMPLGFN